MTWPPRFTFTPEGVIAIWCRMRGVDATLEQINGLVALFESTRSTTGARTRLRLWLDHNFGSADVPEQMDLLACFRYEPPTSWTGPLPSDLDEQGHLFRPVPPARWPFGPPEWHETCCVLREGGLYCDCKASAASDEDLDYGTSP